MRIRNAVIVIVLSLISAVTFSITGQEEALPIVRAKDAPTDPAAANYESFASWRPEPTLYLAVEPIRELAPISLAQAARNNDWITFHDLYVRAQNRGEDVSQYQSLHELWSWSLSDPIGAFYGQDIYERLARAYPGFSTYISEYVLIDRRGNTFYPTAETRAFLLERATRGASPRVVIADATEDPTRALPKVSVASTPEVRTPSRSVATKRAQAKAPVATKPAAISPAATKPAATTDVEPITISATPDPIVDTPPIVATPAPVVAEQPKVATPAPAPAPAPVTRRVAEAPAQTEAVPAPAPEANDLRNRGILLLIIGLLGIGILAVILRAPKEEPRPLVDISDKVHPIRKPGAPTKPNDEHRATGSHG